MVYDFKEYQSKEYHTVLAIMLNSDHRSRKLALFCDGCGDYERCTLLHEQSLLIAKFNTIYEISITTGQARYKDIDNLAGAMGLYKVDDGYILYGEWCVLKLDFDLNEIWSFSGADIFAHPEQKECFRLLGDRIELIDFENTRYTLSLDGTLLEEQKPNEL